MATDGGRAELITTGDDVSSLSRASSDTINGGGGNDTISGDVLASGAGGQAVINGAGDDSIDGGAGEIGRAHVELRSLMRISYAVFCLKNKMNHIVVNSHDLAKRAADATKHNTHDLPATTM